MPFPALIIPAIAIGAGAFGIGKTVKAIKDNSKASDLNEDAKSIVENASKKAEKARENSQTNLKQLGETKLNVLSKSIKPYIELFSLIKNVEFSNSPGLTELNKFILDKSEMQELRQLSDSADDTLAGTITGSVAGAATAWGAYSAVGYLGVASTGTAISGLSGAAATNATLAWLGGGSLASGGLGVAGGTAILGGVVAAPALLVLGCVLGSKASKNLDNARANYAEAKKFREEMNMLCSVCGKISERASFFKNTIDVFNKANDTATDVLRDYINTYGKNFRNYPSDAKENVAMMTKNVIVIKKLLDTPILNEDGSVSSESKISLLKGQINKITGEETFPQRECEKKGGNRTLFQSPDDD